MRTYKELTAPTGSPSPFISSSLSPTTFYGRLVELTSRRVEYFKRRGDLRRMAGAFSERRQEFHGRPGKAPESPDAFPDPNGNKEKR